MNTESGSQLGGPGRLEQLWARATVRYAAGGLYVTVGAIALLVAHAWRYELPGKPIEAFAQVHGSFEMVVLILTVLSCRMARPQGWRGYLALWGITGTMLWAGLMALVLVATGPLRAISSLMVVPWAIYSLPGMLLAIFATRRGRSNA